MSKKTSPQSRPSRRPRTRGPQQSRTTSGVSGNPVATDGARSRRRKPVPETPPQPTTFPGRLRRYLPVALIPNLVAVLTVIVVALAGLMLSSTSLAALPATIAQFWLVLNLVPVQAGGLTIGLLPMLPALGLVWIVARQVHKAVKDRVSLADLGVLAGSIFLVPLVLSAIAAGMLWDASAVYEVAPPDILPAVLKTLVLHAVALVIGMGERLWRALYRRYGIPEGFVANARTAARFLGYLLLAALVVLVLAMAFGWRRQLEIADLYNSVGALIAVVVVSLLYLPNALIGVMAVLVGAEFHIGEASISLFSIHHIPLPPLPLIAAIPPQAPVGAVVLLVVPAALAGYLAYRGNPTFVSAISTGVYAGFFALIGGYLAQGTLGVYGPSGPMVWLMALLIFAWLGLVGLATAALLKLVEQRQNRTIAEATTAEQEEITEGDEVGEESPEVVDGEIAEDEETTEEVVDDEAVDDETAEDETVDDEETAEDIEKVEESDVVDEDAADETATEEAAEESESSEDEMTEEESVEAETAEHPESEEEPGAEDSEGEDVTPRG